MWTPKHKPEVLENSWDRGKAAQIIRHPQLSLFSEMQVITMQTAEESVLKMFSFMDDDLFVLLPRSL